MRKLIIITIVIFSLTAIVAKVTADKLQENERHSHTEEALRDLEDFFLFEQKKNQARDSHYLMRKIIEGNCAKVGETLDNCRYVPRHLFEKFQRFDQMQEVSRQASTDAPEVSFGNSVDLGLDFYWGLIHDPTDYKNNRYLDLQLTALIYGIQTWKHQAMAEWLTQENGALSENTKARDSSERSHGLCQCNTDARECAPIGDYEAQKKQCLEWFAKYTKNSTMETIYDDIRRGHNPGNTAYVRDIKAKTKLLTKLPVS